MVFFFSMTRRKTSGVYHRLRGKRKQNVRLFFWFLTRKKKREDNHFLCELISIWAERKGWLVFRAKESVIDVDGMRKDRLHEKRKTIHIHIDEIHTSIHTTTSIRKEKKWLDSKTMSKFQTSRFDCWIVIYWRCDWIRWSNRIYCCWRICKWNIWCWWKRGNRWWRGLLLLSWCDIGFDILN